MKNTLWSLWNHSTSQHGTFWSRLLQSIQARVKFLPRDLVEVSLFRSWRSYILICFIGLTFRQCNRSTFYVFTVW